MSNWLGEIVENKVPLDYSVLDLGCGILQEFDGEVKYPKFLGMDVFIPYLNHIKDRVMVIQGMLPDGLAGFLDKSFDAVLLLDVLEHLDKSKAVLTLNVAEKIARKIVIVCTPNGYLPQEGWPAWGMPHCQFQAHKCGFELDEFTSKGYSCQLYPNESTQEGNCEAIVAIKEF